MAASNDILILSISRDKNIRREPAVVLRGFHYPHFEQISYNTALRAPPVPPRPSEVPCAKRMEALPQHALGPAKAAPYVGDRFRPVGARAATRRGTSMTTMPVATKLVTWRTPTLIVLCGCLISMMSFGPRATLGLFLTPQSLANGWERDVFGLALAIQNILWGLGQPFAG